MTIIAMGAGILLIALRWRADPSLRAPMPVVFTGGLTVSIVLGLLVIPMVLIQVADADQELAEQVCAPNRD